MNGMRCAQCRETARRARRTWRPPRCSRPRRRAPRSSRGRNTPGWERTRRRRSARCPGRPGGWTRSRCRRGGRARRAPRGCAGRGWSGRSPPRRGRRSRARADAAASCGTVSQRCSSREAASSPRSCSTLSVDGSVAVAMAVSDVCRRSVWTPLPNLPGPQLPGPAPSSTVGADGTPAHPSGGVGSKGASRSPGARTHPCRSWPRRCSPTRTSSWGTSPTSRTSRPWRGCSSTSGVVVEHPNTNTWRLHAAALTHHRGRRQPEPADARLVPAPRRAGGRAGEASIAKPGGDDIGMRRVEQHLEGLRLMGAEVEERDGRVRGPRSTAARRAHRPRHAHRHRDREPDDGRGARRGHHRDQQRRSRAARLRPGALPHRHGGAHHRCRHRVDRHRGQWRAAARHHARHHRRLHRGGHVHDRGRRDLWGRRGRADAAQRPALAVQQAALGGMRHRRGCEPRARELLAPARRST